MTAANPVANRLESLFAAIDGKDTEAFLGHLTADGAFRFGSAPALEGRDAIRAGVTGFFASIAGCRHVVHKVLSQDATLVCVGDVTYHRHDGTEVTLPFTNVFETDGELISEYKIYIDIGPLYAG
jgi:limonene-1,2-epoxide hydrolase